MLQVVTQHAMAQTPVTSYLSKYLTKLKLAKIVFCGRLSLCPCVVVASSRALAERSNPAVRRPRRRFGCLPDGCLSFCVVGGFRFRPTAGAYKNEILYLCFRDFFFLFSFYVVVRPGAPFGKVKSCCLSSSASDRVPARRLCPSLRCVVCVFFSAGLSAGGSVVRLLWIYFYLLMVVC